MSEMSFIVEGDVNISVTVTEIPGGALQFTVEVLNDTGTIGDLNALFMDFADDGLTGSMVIDGEDVTGTALKADGVIKVDSYTNMNGEVVKEFGKFDAGVQFGTSGIGSDDIRVTTFTLSNADTDLTLDMISEQDFGFRLTSVGQEDGARTDSIKMGGTAPEAPSAAAATAVADLIFVNADSVLGDADMFEFINGGADQTVLDNDVNDDGSGYAGAVTAVNGDAANVGQLIAGSNGGYIIVTADGHVDFTAYDADGVNEFDHLAAFELQETSFSYTIEGGSTATVVYSVSGIGDFGGGGGGDGGGIGENFF